MHELSTIARPYAEAVFELAYGSRKVSAWLDFLQKISNFLTVPSLTKAIKTKRCDNAELIKFFLDLSEVDDSIKTQAENFLTVVAKNNRWLALDQVLVHFEQLQAEAEKFHSVKVITATHLPENLQKELENILMRKFNWSKVKLENQLDPNLIGGFIIQIGDRVIDYSLRCQLEKLKASLLIA